MQKKPTKSHKSCLLCRKKKKRNDGKPKCIRYRHDFNADIPRSIVDVLVMINWEYLGSICPRFALPTKSRSFYGEATNIENIHAILNQNLKDFSGISTNFYGLGQSYASSTPLLGTNNDNTRCYDNYRRLWTIKHDSCKATADL